MAGGRFRGWTTRGDRGREEVLTRAALTVAGVTGVAGVPGLGGMDGEDPVGADLREPVGRMVG